MAPREREATDAGAPYRIIDKSPSALRVETDGAPFITAQGASKDDLEFLRARADAAFQKARAG